MPEKHPKTTDSLMRYLRDKKGLQSVALRKSGN